MSILRLLKNPTRGTLPPAPTFFYLTAGARIPKSRRIRLSTIDATAWKAETEKVAPLLKKASMMGGYATGSNAIASGGGSSWGERLKSLGAYAAKYAIVDTVSAATTTTSTTTSTTTGANGVASRANKSEPATAAAAGASPDTSAGASAGAGAGNDLSYLTKSLQALSRGLIQQKDALKRGEVSIAQRVSVQPLISTLQEYSQRHTILEEKRNALSTKVSTLTNTLMDTEEKLGALVEQLNDRAGGFGAGGNERTLQTGCCTAVLWLIYGCFCVRRFAFSCSVCMYRANHPHPLPLPLLSPLRYGSRNSAPRRHQKVERGY